LLLCDWYDPRLRDPIAALELGRKAVVLNPHVPDSWNALGIAFYRTGQWDASVAALQEAFQKAELGTRWRKLEALFYLAMAQCRCGRPGEARKIYRRAVRWMQKSLAAGDILERTTRAEAAGVLGIQELPLAKGKDEGPRKE
jgi:tetratricopeptide (TPR) repeat protein